MFLIREIEAGKTAKGAAPTKLARSKVEIGVEFFSLEQIVEGLEEARLSFANNDVVKVSRKEFITHARDLMSDKYGLLKTILRPKAATGVYAIFNSHMQRFFKRSGVLVKSGGSKPNSIIDLSGDASWEVISRWSAKLLTDCLASHQIGPLLTVNDISGSYENNEDFLEQEISEEDIRNRVNEIEWFMRQYCGDFDLDYRKIAVKHTERFTIDKYYDTFMVLFSNDGEPHIYTGSLYVDNPEEIYFADIWDMVGFDQIAVRRPGGKAWTKTNKNNFVKILSRHLSDRAIVSINYHSDIYLVVSVETLVE